MFVATVKALYTSALLAVFAEDIAVPINLASLYVSPEFPVLQQDYPGVFVDFNIEGDLTQGTIGGQALGYPGTDGQIVPLEYFWRFQGSLEYTAFALSSLERDNLTDELIKLASVHNQYPYSLWHSYMDNNQSINIQTQLDEVGFTGKGQTQSTPWGTDEVMYEQTVTFTVVGEFYVSEPSTTLLPLSSIVVLGTDAQGNLHTINDPSGYPA